MSENNEWKAEVWVELKTKSLHHALRVFDRVAPEIERRDLAAEYAKRAIRACVDDGPSDHHALAIIADLCRALAVAQRASSTEKELVEAREMALSVGWGSCGMTARKRLATLATVGAVDGSVVRAAEAVTHAKNWRLGEMEHQVIILHTHLERTMSVPEREIMGDLMELFMNDYYEPKFDFEYDYDDGPEPHPDMMVSVSNGVLYATSATLTDLNGLNRDQAVSLIGERVVEAMEELALETEQDS